MNLDEFITWQNECEKRYIFLGKGGFMGRGVPFECGPGWQKLLEELFEELEEIRVRDKLEEFTVVQLKEKFGGLRVYTSYNTDAIDEAIDKAEEKAWNTCMTCGKPGKYSIVYGWRVTYCPKCLKEYTKEQDEWRNE